MSPPGRFTRIVLVEGPNGERYGIEFLRFVDSDDWAMAHRLAEWWDKHEEVDNVRGLETEETEEMKFLSKYY